MLGGIDTMTRLNLPRLVAPLEVAYNWGRLEKVGMKAVSTPEERGPNAGWEFASCGMSGFIWHTVGGWRIDQLGAFSRTAVRKEIEAAR